MGLGLGFERSCHLGGLESLECIVDHKLGAEWCRSSRSNVGMKSTAAIRTGKLLSCDSSYCVKNLAGWSGFTSCKNHLGFSSHVHPAKHIEIECNEIFSRQRRVRKTLVTKCGSGKELGVESASATFRKLLQSPGLHLGPASHDALSAKLVEQAGFSFTFMSGFAVSAVRLALPDTGLISYAEMIDQGRQITSAVNIPVIGDGDSGYGNALNVKRTVKGYIQAGFAGIILEDQVSPKACGHTQGRQVVSREEAITRIKAAVDAREEALSEFVIIARTDARQAISLDEALWRVEAFAKAGADVLFIDALSSKEEMLAFCKVSYEVPKMANMLEGGGKTPLLTPLELETIGFKIVAYPLSLLGASICAMQDALVALKGGRFPRPGSLPSFDEIKDVVGFNRYYEEEARYSFVSSTIIPSPKIIDPAQSEEDMSLMSKTEETETDSMPSVSSKQTLDQQLFELGTDSTSAFDQQQPSTETEAISITPDVVQNEYGSNKSSFSGIWSRVLRVKLTGSGGLVKLDIRIPAGFLDGLARTIPGIMGLNIGSLVNEAASKMDGNFESGQQLVDISDQAGDRFQIFLE